MSCKIDTEVEFCDSFGQSPTMRPNGKNVASIGDAINFDVNGGTIQNDVKLNENRRKKRNRRQRCRKRMSQLLHTHVVLIAVCILSALDAICVLGQIISDILIMSDTQHENELLQEKAVAQFKLLCPALSHSGTDHTLHLDEVLQQLVQNISACTEEEHSENEHLVSDHIHDEVIQEKIQGNKFNFDFRSRTTRSVQQNQNSTGVFHTEEPRDTAHRRSKRALGVRADDHEHPHSLTREITHYFHIGSMTILSVLLFEALLKIIAMGTHFLHHKLEVFDAFVVTVSWCLDVAFWEGIWAHPGTEAATILIIILPWRIIRIVNSSVLVIKEKDLVELKIAKQQYRRAMKGAKVLKRKLDMYRVESRQLQGLCRKHGVDEAAIISCAPIEYRRKRNAPLRPSQGKLNEFETSQQKQDETAV